MKLQNVIAALAALAPMVVVAEELFGGKYPYCTGCEAKYENEDGQWNYIDHTWCKVNEEKCNVSTCKPVDGYPCCSDPSTKVQYVDFDGEWGVENNNWCIRNPLPEFTDVKIKLNSWLDLMPGPGDPEAKKKAYFGFELGINKAEFKKKYEIKMVSINDENINIEELYYPDSRDYFRIDTTHYEEGTNTVKLIILNKETKQSYLKEIIQELSYAF